MHDALALAVEGKPRPHAFPISLSVRQRNTRKHTTPCGAPAHQGALSAPGPPDTLSVSQRGTRRHATLCGAPAEQEHQLDLLVVKYLVVLEPPL